MSTNSRTATDRRAARLRWRALCLGVAGLTALGLVLTPPAVADDDPSERKRQVDREIVELQQDLEGTSTELAEASAQLERTRQELEEARADLQEKQQDLREAEQHDERVGRDLEVAEAAQRKIEGALADNEEDQEQTRGAVATIARESYKNGALGNLSTTLEVLTGGEDPVESMSMARTVMQVQDGTIKRLATQQAEGLAEEDRLAGAQREVARLKAESEASVLRADAAREDAQQAAGSLAELEAQHARDTEQLEQRKETEEGRLAQAQQESEELEAELAERARKAREAREAAQRAAAAEQARQEAAAKAAQEAAEEARRQAAEEEARRQAASRNTPRAAPEPEPVTPAPQPRPVTPAPEPPPAPPAPVTGGPLIHPVAAPTSSEFGYRMHPVLGHPRLHTGLDYAAACGTPVVAPYAGTIIYADTVSGLGNRVVIDHGFLRDTNLTTVYGHLSGWERRGGQVSQGQVIGYVGTTGTSTGCHLHWETRQDGTPVNPRSWL